MQGLKHNWLVIYESEDNSFETEENGDASKEYKTQTKKMVKASALKGAATYKSVYKGIWENEFPITAANGNKRAFYCLLCKRNISCSHMGRADVKKHCDSSAHKEMEKVVKSSQSIQSMFVPGNSNLAEKTIEAEVLHTNFIVQHNLSYMTADHLAPLYAKMFPGSKIEKNFKCSLKDSLVAYLKNNPLSITNDGSSDNGINKMNPECVFIFDINNSKRVQFKFYDMCVTTGEDWKGL